MKSKLVAIVLAVVVLGGGVGAYLLTKSDSTENSSNDTSQATNQAEKKSDSNPTFSPLATDNESFRANMEVTSATEGESFSGVIERAKSGDIHFTGSQAGEEVEFFVTAVGEYIFCQAEQCFKLADGTTPITDADVTASDEEIAKYKDTAVYKGTEACVSGSCEVWEYTGEENEKVTVYVSKDDNRVVEMRSTDNQGSDFRLTYEYEDVTITLPENVSELPGGI